MKKISSNSISTAQKKQVVMKKNATCPHQENTEENLISISSPHGERMESRSVALRHPVIQIFYTKQSGTLC
jgi:hypothetical protein